MNASLKIGSVLHVPLPAGSSLFTSDNTIVGIVVANNVATLTALKTGSCTVFLALSTDFRAELTVNVTAT